MQLRPPLIADNGLTMRISFVSTAELAAVVVDALLTRQSHRAGYYAWGVRFVDSAGAAAAAIRRVVAQRSTDFDPRPRTLRIASDEFDAQCQNGLLAWPEQTVGVGAAEPLMGATRQWRPEDRIAAQRAPLLVDQSATAPTTPRTWPDNPYRPRGPQAFCRHSPPSTFAERCRTQEWTAVDAGWQSVVKAASGE